MVLLFSTAVQINVTAQYYYKDIVSNKRSLAEKNLLQEQKIRNVMVHGFEGDKTPTKGFYCKKEISKNYRTVETFTKSNISNKSLLTSYYNQDGQLIKTIDTSEIAASTTSYAYDAQGNIATITSLSNSYDEDFATSLKEVRHYKFDGKNRLTQIVRIRNDKDSVLIDFLQDEKGNITDEIESKNNGKHYYYYYDDKNRLTDIVQYNVVKAALVPDFIFEYDRQGQLTQMISVEEGMSGDYYTWHYIYNDEGMKIIEKIFSREKILLGYLEYEYD